MKKLLITVVVLLVIAAGGLYAIAKLAPMDRINQVAFTAVKTHTVRELSF